MFSTDLNIILSTWLAKVLPEKYSIDDSTLLRTYATFYIQKNRSEDAILSLPLLENDDSQEIESMFLSIDILDFVRYATPCIVADIDRFSSLWKKHLEKNALNNRPVDLIVNLLVVKGNLKPFIKEIISGHKFNRAINEYRACMKHYPDIVQFSPEDLKEFVESVFLIALDQNEKAVRFHVGSKDIGPKKIAKIMNDSLRLPKLQQLGICEKFYDGNCISGKSIFDEIKNPVFCSLSENEIKQCCLDLVKSFSSCNPLEVLCALYVGKKSIAYDRVEGKERKAEGEKTVIDVVIENTLIFDLFSSSIFMPLRNDEARILVVFPSPFFIRKWNECEKLNDCNVTFVVFDTKEETQTENITATANLLNINYSYPFVASSSERHFTFENFNSWIMQEEEQNQYDKVLLFETKNNDECRSELLSKLHSLGKQPEFFVLSSDSSFSDPLSIAYSILNSEEYAQQHVGVADSASQLAVHHPAVLGNDSAEGFPSCPCIGKDAESVPLDLSDPRPGQAGPAAHVRNRDLVYVEPFPVFLFDFVQSLCYLFTVAIIAFHFSPSL